MIELDGLLAQLSSEEYCYLTTTGRISGRPHEIEIWFGLKGGTVYMLSGSDKSDWFRNLRKHPSVTVQIARYTFTGSARLVENKAEDAAARYSMAEKYQEWEQGTTLSQWARTALPVAIDVQAVASK